MKYSEKTKPGMGDPYWYEWTVGQKYIVEMLNPDSHIQYVELQSKVELGLDDVVVTYDNGKTRFIQVKHTRNDDTMTFGDLVTVKKTQKDSNSQGSLLAELARAWYLEKNNYADSEVYLFTNRKAGNRVSSKGNGRNRRRPALNEFLLELQKQLLESEKFSDLVFPQNIDGWNEWCNQLAVIEKDEDKLTFLKNFHIKTDKESLEDLVESIKKKFQTYFGVSANMSEILLGKLDHALRKWTTSHRDNSKITVETLYNELSLIEEVYRYNHDLIPVSPFFDSREKLVNEIESDLLNGKEKLIYLSGVPGTGKTNIISKLCSKNDSIIDIRYYAYEPIDPAKEYLPSDVSQRVNKDIFWDTLLNQLRELLVGRLYKYRVPVLNNFLNLKEKKNEFFRIASEFAKDRNRVFVLAVDGLDHAARAGVVDETFLPTLPNPEYIPDNVKIIIAGQPKKNFSNYPDWLFIDNDNIKHCVVPDIQPDDIKSLVDSKCENYSALQKKLVSKITCKYAGGNTLSAIFAVHESLKCSDPISFEERLKSRKLSGNIQEYYRTIWKDAKDKMQIPFVDYKVAGAFAFFNEPISAYKLSLIFKNEGISCSSWNNILKALSPLLIETDGTYTILHNDIRIYLSSVIGRDQEHVKEIYSNLVDYYLTQENKTVGFYRDVIRFLVSSNREDEFPIVYTPEYILNAYVIGIELIELNIISDELMKYVINEKSIDWNKFRSVMLGYMTIEQIRKSSDEIEGITFRKSLRNIDVHPFECKSIPFSKLDNNNLSKLLLLIDDLYNNNEESRAKTLFMNWFSKLKLSEIQEIINKEDNHNDDEIAELLSKACINSKYFNIFKDFSENSNNSFIYKVFNSITNEIINNLHGDDLENALDSLKVIPHNSLINGIKNLLNSNHYEDLKNIRNSLSRRTKSNPISKMVLTFLNIITKSATWDEKESNHIWSEIELIEFSNKNISNIMSYYSIYALVSSYLQNKERTEIAQKVTDIYIESHNYKKPQYFLIYFNSLTYLGKWLKSQNENNQFNDSVDDLCNILQNLYCKYWMPNDRDFETPSLSAYILKAYITLSEKENLEFRNSISPHFEQIFKDFPVNQLLDPGILFYKNNLEKVQLWVDIWLTEDGKVWSEPINDRNSIIQKFIEIKSNYDFNNSIDLRGAVERAKWSIIGFSSHKEYCVETILDIYNILVERFPDYISDYGEIVKNLSDKIELLGDNRTEYTLNSKVYSDWGSRGPSQIRSVFQNKVLLSQCISNPSYIIDMLVGYLKVGTHEKKDLLSIWGIGIGLLDWRNENDHSSIFELQKSIENCATENGIFDIRNELSKLGPAYIEQLSEPISNNAKNNAIGVDDANKLLTKYITDNIDVPSYKIAEAMNVINISDTLSNEKIIQVFEKALSKDNYGIYQNSIFEFVLNAVDEQDIDKLIKRYISTEIDNDSFYPYLDLPTIVRWRLKYKEEEYIVELLNSLVETYMCWITASNNIKEPELIEEYDYLKYVEFDSEDIFENLVKILLLVVISDDADAIRVALGGIAALLRVNISYISEIEAFWNKLHYQAKEWILMVYELVLELCPEHQETIYKYLVRHSIDDDFNAALYSKMLCENINPEFTNEYSVDKKSFFDLIPSTGKNLLIEKPKDSPYINGNKYVLEQNSYLTHRLNTNLEDIERRTSDFSKNIIQEFELLPLYRRHLRGYHRFVYDKVILAFNRVLYKDWYDGRWDGIESEIARVVLSASEPFTLLLSPNKWKSNNGMFFENLEDIISLPEEERSTYITELFQTGINSDELVLAGAINDYHYGKQLFGYLLSYFDISEMIEQYETYASSAFEKNSRLCLKKREDYVENQNFNITQHQNGFESFHQSNIMCGFKNEVLALFGWQIKFNSDGLALINPKNEIIGRLECFYGTSNDIYYRGPSSQPYLQRWIVNATKLQMLLNEIECPYIIKTLIRTIIINNSIE